MISEINSYLLLTYFQLTRKKYLDNKKSLFDQHIHFSYKHVFILVSRCLPDGRNLRGKPRCVDYCEIRSICLSFRFMFSLIHITFASIAGSEKIDERVNFDIGFVYISTSIKINECWVACYV